MIVPADEVKKVIENNPVLKASCDNYFKTLTKYDSAPKHDRDNGFESWNDGRGKSSFLLQIIGLT